MVWPVRANVQQLEMVRHFCPHAMLLAGLERAAQLRSEENRQTQRNERARVSRERSAMELTIVFQAHRRERTDATVQVVDRGTLAHIHSLPIVPGEVLGDLARAKVGLLSCFRAQVPVEHRWHTFGGRDQGRALRVSGSATRKHMCSSHV